MNIYRKRKHTGLMLVIFCIFLCVSCENRAYKEELYRVKLQQAGNLIMGASYSCINISKSYVTIWEYARASEIDFEQAKKEMNFMGGTNTRMHADELKAGIAQIVKNLKDAPDKYDEAYGALDVLEQIYLDIYKLAFNPEGTQEEYADAVDELETELLQQKQELDMLIAAVDSPN